MEIEWLDASEGGEQNRGALVGALCGLNGLASPEPGWLSAAMWIEWLGPSQELWRRAVGTSWRAGSRPMPRSASTLSSGSNMTLGL